MTVFCKCGNHARYITIQGEFTCATCPIVEGVDSIRLADVPRLLAWARAHESGSEYHGDTLRQIIGKDISRDPK